MIDRGRHGERGLALLSAVIVAAIVAALAFGIGQRTHFDIAATSRVLEAHSADGLFLALEQAARASLRADLLETPLDSADEAWAAQTFSLNEPRGGGDARLSDLQGLFNLNNLVASAETMQPADSAAAASGRPAAASATSDADAATAGPDDLAADGNDAYERLLAAMPADAVGVEDATPQNEDALPSTSVALKRLRISTLPAPLDNRVDGGVNGATNGTPTAAGAGARSPGAVAPANAANPLAATLESASNQAVSAITAAANGEQQTGAPTVTRWQVAVARFTLLLAALDIDDGVVPAILDWLDEDGDTRFPGGAEDDYYMGLERPYRAANRAFADVSELRLVRGITPEIYARLLPFVSVLPRPSDINVNLAPLEVLMSLGPGIDRGTAEVLDGARKVQPFQSSADFIASPMLVGRPLLDSGLGTASSWFALKMHAETGASRYSARTILARNGPDQIEVVSRTRGYFDD